MTTKSDIEKLREWLSIMGEYPDPPLENDWTKIISICRKLVDACEEIAEVRPYERDGKQTEMAAIIISDARRCLAEKAISECVEILK